MLIELVLEQVIYFLIERVSVVETALSVLMVSIIFSNYVRKRFLLERKF